MRLRIDGAIAEDDTGVALVLLITLSIVVIAGEFQSELWLDTNVEQDDEALLFLLYDPPLTGTTVRLGPDDGGVYQMSLGGGVYEYAFERVK